MAITLKFERAAWLAAWLMLVLVALTSHYRALGAGATSIYEPGSLGVTFQDETAEDGTSAHGAPNPQAPFLSQSAGNAMQDSSRQRLQQQQQQQQQRQQSGSRITGGQFLRPRTQATSKELLRRRHIAELLNAIADEIPKQKKQEPKRQLQLQPVRSSSTPAAEMPIYRNSRTFPSAGSTAAAAASYLRQPASGSDQLLAIGWPVDGSGPIVGGRGTAGGNLRESRKANFATTGLVWGATHDGQPVLQRVWPSPGGPIASPPYFSQHTANAAAASTKSARARTRPLESPSGELAQLTANSLDGEPTAHPHQHQQQQQRHHLRSGSEEVALHTPLNSRDASSDYEWKRVENSRNSWNNLRGMWGKRSSPSNDLGDTDADLEQQRQRQDGNQFRRELSMLLDELAASSSSR